MNSFPPFHHSHHHTNHLLLPSNLNCQSKEAVLTLTKLGVYQAKGAAKLKPKILSTSTTTNNVNCNIIYKEKKHFINKEYSMDGQIKAKDLKVFILFVAKFTND